MNAMAVLEHFISGWWNDLPLPAKFFAAVVFGMALDALILQGRILWLRRKLRKLYDEQDIALEERTKL